MKTEFPENKWKNLSNKLVYPNEDSIDDYQKPVNNLKKKDFFSKLKNDYPSDEETEGTKEIIKLFNIENGEENNTTLFKK